MERIQNIFIAALLLAMIFTLNVTAQTVEVAGTADVSDIQTQIDTLQGRVDQLATTGSNNADAIEQIKSQLTDEPDNPDEPDSPSVGKTTDLWLNLANFVEAPYVRPLGDGRYEVDPEFTALIGQWSGIRYLNWSGLLRWGVNDSWANRANDDLTQDRPADDPWPDLATKWGKTGLPIEAIIQTANATQTHVWWTGPVHASPEFYRQAGALFVRDLNPNLNIVIEVGNEVWDSYRGRPYHRSVDFGGAMRRYARDAAAKFEAFADGGFPAERTTRVMGGKLDQVDVLKFHILPHLDASEYDAITCSGYFGNSPDTWLNGPTGLVKSVRYLQQHGQLARDVKKLLLIYELNIHIDRGTSDLQLVDSEPVMDGVALMIQTAKDEQAGAVCVYRGPGLRTAKYPWSIYTTDLRSTPIVDRLGLPALK